MQDLEPFHGMQSNEKVMRYIKKPLNYEESKTELKKFIGYYTDTTRFFRLWAIENKSYSDFVGLCGVYHNELNENEIAYRLRERFWGQGIGLEIAKGLISYCFEELGLEEIIANVDEENTGSVRILEREMRFVEREYVEGRERYSRKYRLVKE